MLFSALRQENDTEVSVPCVNKTQKRLPETIIIVTGSLQLLT